MIKWLLAFLGKGPKTQKTTKGIEESELTYIRVENLELGMYVAKLDCPWLESPFKLQGFNLTTQRELNTLRGLCHHVYIDRFRQSKLSMSAKKTFSGKKLLIGDVPPKKGSFEKEISKATHKFAETGELINDFMEKVEDGGSVDTSLAKDAVASSVSSILNSPDAYLWLTQLKSTDKRVAQHSLNVSMLSIILGRQIGLSEQELRNVGLCGMMHDMGKMLIPSAIRNKKTALSSDEQAVMKTHTTLGAELLKSSENMFHGAIETALTHHETINGQGYPKGLKDSDVSYYSNMVSIVNEYDNLTTDRPYRKALTHLQATQVLYQQAGEKFDRLLVSKFIESLGVFPPGCYVELSDNRIALVLETNTESKLRPKIMAFMDNQMSAIKKGVINLDKVLIDLKGKPLRIQNIINPDDFNIDRKKHFQDGVIEKGFLLT